MTDSKKSLTLPQFNPLPMLFTVEKDKGTLTFINSKGLHFKNKNTDLFEVANVAAGIFYPAKAVLKKDKKGNFQIELTSKQVKNPDLVRYAWGNATLPDVYNEQELPLSSFILAANALAPMSYLYQISLESNEFIDFP
jgi:sialate O-acetylesterase